MGNAGRFFLCALGMLVLLLSSESIGFSKHDAVKHVLPDRPVSYADDSIFALRIAQAKAKGIDTLPIGERIAAIGKLFLGTPYIAGTLDSDSVNENLVVDLRGFDCVTFYESSLALALAIRHEGDTIRAVFEDALTWMRYVGGSRDGYCSRLHYTLYWFENNERRGTVRIVTRGVGASYVKRKNVAIDFMSSHRSLYRQLAHNDSLLECIRLVEQGIHYRNSKGFYYIPKERIAKVEGKIQTGDIIGVTTNTLGLDCSHTGIAIRMPDGRIHFMHASSLIGKVIISEEPLADYLTHSSHQTGIIIARAREHSID